MFEAAPQATPFDDALLDELDVEFKEVQENPPTAEAMVSVSHISDHLERTAEANWKAPANHPDLEPAHEVLLMRELFTETLRTEVVKRQPDHFLEWLKGS